MFSVAVEWDENLGRARILEGRIKVEDTARYTMSVGLILISGILFVVRF